MESDLAHTSYVIPKCFKFPFLRADDFEIGPCFTYPSYRGKRIYPAVPQYINAYVGTEKSGFERCGTVKVSRFTKKYRLE